MNQATILLFVVVVVVVVAGSPVIDNQSLLVADFMNKGGDGMSVETEKDHSKKIFIYSDLPTHFTSDQSSQPHTIPNMVDFEQRMFQMIRDSKYHTSNPDEATHFFVPIRVLAYCGALRKSKGGYGCVESRQFLAESISWIKSHHSSRWNPTSGSNHLFAIGYDWGSTFGTFQKDAVDLGRVPELENARVIGFIGSTEGGGLAPGMRKSDVVLPPFVGNEKLDALLKTRNQNHEKTLALYFRGAAWTDEERGKLIKSISSYHNSVVSEEKVPTQVYAQEMASSRFCLTPAGTAPWSFRHSEAILAGCMPVVPDSSNVVLPCQGMVDHASFSILGKGKDYDALRAEMESKEHSTQFLESAEHSLTKAQEVYAYGDTTMECLVQQL